MPILGKEEDLFPSTLLDDLGAGEDETSFPADEETPRWWTLYTLSRREKQLMRQLRQLEVPFYGPLIPKRYRSPGGRLRESYMPLFTNYVFIYGDAHQRYQAVCTGSVSRHLEVAESGEFTHQLRQVQQLIALKRPITAEARLEEGDPVRIKTGPFQGMEGYVIRRQHKTRLLIWVHMLCQGVSVEMDEALLEACA